MKHNALKLIVLLLITTPAYLAAETYTFNYTAGHSVHMKVGEKLVEVYGKLGDTVKLVPVPNETQCIKISLVAAYYYSCLSCC